jgi:outer membrane protein
LIAITDVQEAQAAFDLATANEIQAVNQVDLALEALREVIGEYAQQLEPLGERMPLLSPDPTDIEVWTQQALTQNLEIEAQRALVRQAAEEIKRQRAGHYPTLDIVGSYGEQSSGGRFGATEIDFTALGLQLNVPLFSGGLVSSQVREAAHRYQESLQVLEQTARGIQRRTRDAYLGVESGISRVKALKQAVLSNQTSVEATKAGFEVGTRTTVDVVAAEQGLFRARRDYARARYDYLVNALRLRQAAGSLSQLDLLEVNTWLGDADDSEPPATDDDS